MTPEQIEAWLRRLEEAAMEPAPPPPPYRVPAKPPVKLTPEQVARMRHMRREGFTVGDIARAFKCTWETARRRTLGFHR